jgi:hypothetical protein
MVCAAFFSSLFSSPAPSSLSSSLRLPPSLFSTMPRTGSASSRSAREDDDESDGLPAYAERCGKEHCAAESHECLASREDSAIWLGVLPVGQRALELEEVDPEPVTACWIAVSHSPAWDAEVVRPAPATMALAVVPTREGLFLALSCFALVPREPSPVLARPSFSCPSPLARWCPFCRWQFAMSPCLWLSSSPWGPRRYRRHPHRLSPRRPCQSLPARTHGGASHRRPSSRRGEDPLKVCFLGWRAILPGGACLLGLCASPSSGLSGSRLGRSS